MDVKEDAVELNAEFKPLMTVTVGQSFVLTRNMHAKTPVTAVWR